MKEETYKKVLKKKLHSMRYLKKEVQKETSQDAKQFMYGYTECINDILEYIHSGGDGFPEHQLQPQEQECEKCDNTGLIAIKSKDGISDSSCNSGKISFEKCPDCKKEQEKQTAEEILKHNVPRIENHPNYDFILKAMEEYVSQSQSSVLPREELYRKIYINNEADLPKENGWYSVHSIGANINDSHNSCWLGYIYKQAWLRDYDWYLQPQEQEKSM